MFFHAAAHSLNNKEAHDIIRTEMKTRSLEHPVFDKLDNI